MFKPTFLRPLIVLVVLVVAFPLVAQQNIPLNDCTVPVAPHSSGKLQIHTSTTRVLDVERRDRRGCGGDHRNGRQGGADGAGRAGGKAIYGETAVQSAFTTFGVYGISNSSAINSAGVAGLDASGLTAWYPLSVPPAGVVGLSNSGTGVLGESENRGVIGVRENANGTGFAEGDLGYSTHGVFAFGDIREAETAKRAEEGMKQMAAERAPEQQHIHQ